MRTSLLSNYLPDFLVTPRGCASATLVAIALLAWSYKSRIMATPPTKARAA